MADPNALTAQEAAGLWHAVEWMKLCLEADPADGIEAEALEKERTRYAAARRALTKIQKARRLARAKPHPRDPHPGGGAS